MESVWSKCSNFLKTDEAKRNLKEYFLLPMGNLLYKEMYFYIWLICFYHIFLILIVIISAIILLRQQYMIHFLIKNGNFLVI